MTATDSWMFSFLFFFVLLLLSVLFLPASNSRYRIPHCVLILILLYCTVVTGYYFSKSRERDPYVQLS